MDKKPLMVGNLCVEVLLVLGSLSNVVGYQTVKSTMNDSPLFTTRAPKATNQQQDILTFQYLGMDKENYLQIPYRNTTTEQLKKAVDIISNMDDTAFARFTELCIKIIKENNALRKFSPTDMVQILFQLRTNSETHNDFVEDEPPSIFYFSLCGWRPGCILHLFIAGVIAIAVVLAFILDGILHPTENITCRSVVIC